LVGSLAGTISGSFSSFNYIYFGNPNTNDWPSANGKLDNIISEQPISTKQWDGNGHYYEIIQKEISWTDAKKYAENRQFTDPGTGNVYKGHLATITSPEENSFIVQKVFSPLNAQNSGVWLGGFKKAGKERPTEGWCWITDEPWSWTNWNPDEPNDLTGSNQYLEIWGSNINCQDRPIEYCPKIGMWNDESHNGWSGVTKYAGRCIIIVEYGSITPARIHIGC
jgi:hypothetical protein